jgi:hypothetical protein
MRGGHDTELAKNDKLLPDTIPHTAHRKKLCAETEHSKIMLVLL